MSPARSPRALSALSRIAGLAQSWSELPAETVARQLLQTITALVGASYGEVRVSASSRRSIEYRVGAGEGLGLLFERLIGGRLAFDLVHRDGDMGLFARPLGSSSDSGVLGVAARRADFPNVEDRLIVDAAANQAWMAIQLAWLREALQSARGREEHLKDVLDDAPTAAHWVNADGVIIYANKADHALLGFPPGELVGRRIFDLHVDKRLLAGILARISRGETVQDQRAPLYCRDGGVKWVLIDSNAYVVNGRFMHSRCFVRDDTKPREELEALRRRLAEIEARSGGPA